MTQFVHQIGRQIEYRFAHIRPRQGDDILPGAHHLSDFHVPGIYHAVMVGMQGAVADPIRGLPRCGIRLVTSGTRTAELRDGLIQLRLGADTAIEQLLLAFRIRLGVEKLCLATGSVALARTQGVLLVGGVERGKFVTGAYLRPDIDPTFRNATADPEAERRFVTCLDAAGKAPDGFLLLRLNLDVKDGADRGLWRWVVGAGGDGERQKEEKSQPYSGNR
ncbi:hypothetical protein GCM10009304_22590 [Pseudomonas matsuisoli]|uniref:Uncharacterized protein n=1 Tax=Pseudomonas matsuisoli TaxID=1515666 RepID=A0A917UYL8_9PSED|nr:hypothetical protein GCM10009304_22590 [Pseudomonas matsuisoli]